MLSWDEIKERYPDQWVVLGEPVFDGVQVLSGIVISHHADKRIASMEGGERRTGFKNVLLIFTGNSAPVRRIGIMRRIRQI